MNENDFEGTLVLEKMAELNKVEAFMEAVEADDFRKVQAMMKKAGVDALTISMVLKKMHEANGD